MLRGRLSHKVVCHAIERGAVIGESAQSKLQSRRACRIGERCHPAVVTKLTAVEADLFQTGGLSPFGHHSTNHCGRVLVTTEADGITELFFHRTGRCKRATGGIVDDLCIDVLVRTKDRETGAVCRATNEPSHAVAATDALTENRAGVVHGGCCCSEGE